ncbi:MAG TPA: protein-disulfide reductase DsbD N-terminal domain-containing protein [Vicinamibacterales bacterium]|nr:protein-disulfide reductase DsbD N-terminal domain-containing protein [Vicinamibacterales bacterium]
MRQVMFFWLGVAVLITANLRAAQFTTTDPSRIDTKHLTITTSTSAATVAPGERLSLYVDVSPKPKMHVYAPDQTDYIPIELKVEPASSFKAEAIQYPAAEQFFFAPLEETQRVYSKPFRIRLPIALAQNVATPLTIKGTVRYQACDDAICYLPQTVGVTWKVAMRSR